MALGDVKVWLEWTERTRLLKDAEKGRLIDALVLYAKGEDVEDLLSGNERYVFPTFQVELDRDAQNYAAVSEKRAAAGRMGGMAKASNVKQVLASASKPSKEKEKEKEKDKGEGYTSSISADAQDPIFGYALDALSFLSPTAMEELASYRADLGDDLVRYAIDEAAANDCRKWSYVKAVLENIIKAGAKTVGEARAAYDRQKTKTQPAGKVNLGNNYTQREYDDTKMAHIGMTLDELTGGGS